MNPCYFLASVRFGETNSMNFRDKKDMKSNKASPQEQSGGGGSLVARKSDKTQEGDASGKTRQIVPRGGRDLKEGESQETAAAGSGGRIGERLVSMGIISEDQLNVALQEKKVSGKLLGEVLVDLGFISEETLTTFLAESSGFEVFNPKLTILDGEALGIIDKGLAVKHQVLPVSVTNDMVVVAMADPYDVVALDALRRFLPKNITIKQLVTTPSILSEAIDAAYGYASSISGILKELEEGQAPDLATLKEEEAYTHPIVRLVNALVFDAVKLSISDLHFEPEENFVRLRYRKDGVLYTAQILHRNHWSAISQRLKIMSNMNIADKMSPQDGRFNMNVGGRVADFRVSSLPTVHGENIVLRVLDQSQSIVPLENLGFSEGNLVKIRRAQERPEGIIIVTGPTGSGKTTSLYSMINEINDVEVNIQTMEDPVEYSLPMIRQTPIREGVLDFADGIRAILRQDPDIIFIGEIRDPTTAEMALKAAMTGHQVYTTLHTNDSFGAIPRLLDLGLKPGMVSGAIIAVFAQRLVRRLCKECRVPYQPDEKECQILKADPKNPPTVYKAKQGGCQVCGGQGYKGRISIAEILLIDEDLDEIIANNGSKAQMRHAAIEKGFKSMKDDGILKILEGITTLSSLADAVDINA
ncbi:MAG: Flp pilus assembly complex ATPase component TadA [Proteobacteria bacterium]|nr:Flp pilus assembly complex ATPase component TadA [Pseudomonadota bacterium]